MTINIGQLDAGLILKLPGFEEEGGAFIKGNAPPTG